MLYEQFEFFTQFFSIKNKSPPAKFEAFKSRIFTLLISIDEKRLQIIHALRHINQPESMYNLLLISLFF